MYEKYRMNLRSARHDRKIKLENGTTRKTSLKDLSQILEQDYKIKCSVDLLGKIERGERNPGYELVMALSEIFNLSISKLFPDEILKMTKKRNQNSY